MEEEDSEEFQVVNQVISEAFSHSGALTNKSEPEE